MLDADHAFRFEGVALDAGLVYIVTVAYANYIFSSDMIAAEDLTAGQEVNLPVEITTPLQTARSYGRIGCIFSGLH